ncbi:MAG: hypothetical protein C6W57_05295 [Caldibacillus debilis]|nr:MAG: hypothetical protein C6W57_05295 [Caldibacillus debilis]
MLDDFLPMSDYPEEMLDIPPIRPKPMLNIQSGILDKTDLFLAVFPKMLNIFPSMWNYPIGKK